MAEKIFVLGSNSFSGAHFVNYILDQSYEAIGTSRSPEINHVFLPYRWGELEKLKHFKFYQLDINSDLNEIMDLINECKPDYVVNFASQSMVAESWQNPEHWMMTNVVSTIKFHDRLRECSFLRKYVHISTPEVYGSCEGLVKESTNYNPSTPYAVSRAACDMSLMTFFKAYKFPVIFTRAANVYGPGQQLYRIIPRTILFFLIKKKLQLHGGGLSVRSFIHIKDVLVGTLLAMKTGLPGEIYHFSTKENISIRSLVKMIADKLGMSFDDNVETVGERLGKDSVYLLNSMKAHQGLGWDANISLEKGIEDTIKWVEKNIEELKKLPFDYIQIYGKATGCSGGKGGSMHLIDETVGFMGSTPIVGGTIPVGTGLGLSIKLNGTDHVSCVFFGDGSTEEGVFYESLNFAVLKELPVLYICENNFYSVYSPLCVRQPSGRSIFEMMRCLGIESSKGDGNDVIDVYSRASQAVNYIREEGKPFFLEFPTYRWREHCGPNFDNDIGYRTYEEYCSWKERDPIVSVVSQMKNNREIIESEIENMEKLIREEIEEAFHFAEISQFPNSEEAFTHLFK
ncbi:MAG: GDP-mannose 4,6-dehydratase [Nitrospirae bacterium]|nr:GDP-mannose 4,6-dehydratase [Nitrospirota bacterium]